MVSWIDAFPSNTHHTGSLALSLVASNDDDEDLAQNNHPCHDRRLPARFRTGDFVPSDTPCAPCRFRPPASYNSRATPPPQPYLTYDTNNNNNNNNNNSSNNNNVNNNNTDTPDTPDTPDTLQTPDLNNNDHTPVKFSLPADALTRFISRASRFTIAEGRLWRRQHSGRHQLYARPSSRYALVRDTHDKLGHKGLYSTRRALLDRFWWPALETDIKWYVQTCHQCQI